MMEMWTDNLLWSGEWGLDLPFHQEDGPYGDLKSTGLSGTDVLSFQPQDADQRSASSERRMSSEEGGLDSEWMESNDLGAYLEKLCNSDPVLQPLDSGLHELDALILPQQEIVAQDVALGGLNSPTNVKDTFSIAVSTSSTDETFDALLSPPVSPEQVTPVIKLEPISPVTVQAVSLNQSEGSHPEVDPLTGPDFLDEFSFSSVSQADDHSFVYLDESAEELINSPLSADEVDITLSVSEPTSPKTNSSKPACAEIIIQSNPELYKVITTSLHKPGRYAPYQKSKAAQEQKHASNRRSPAQPVPEHIINGQVNKKDRKKLQNKNAAIRYRQKKKEEAKGIKSEEQELEEYNTSLKTKVEDLEREIKYMKNLMEDVLKAKGLI